MFLFEKSLNFIVMLLVHYLDVVCAVNKRASEIRYEKPHRYWAFNEALHLSSIFDSIFDAAYAFETYIISIDDIVIGTFHGE